MTKKRADDETRSVAEKVGKTQLKRNIPSSLNPEFFARRDYFFLYLPNYLKPWLSLIHPPSLYIINI